jgi:cytoskeletal protein CcmA (bactofilin family)
MFSHTRTDGAGDSSNERDTAGSQASGRRSGEPSIVNAELKVKGDLESSGDIQVYGRVDGDITSRSITICPGARVNGSVKADSVRISGELEGQIEAPSVNIEKGAKVRGDIIHDSLAVESGAEIEGHCRRLTKPAAKTASSDKTLGGDAKTAQEKSFDTLDLKKEDAVEKSASSPFKPAGAAN